MKKQIYLLMAVAAMASCSQDEILPGVDGTEASGALKVTVADKGYGSDSRAAEDGLTTVFTKGDRIGVFAVENGQISDDCNNASFTATENADGWIADFNHVLIDKPGITYYAYYPYMEQLPAAVDPTATDAAGFFAPVAAAWNTASDQSDYAAYTASDLMTAKGSIDGSSLSFGMNHRMALVIVNFPQLGYTFDNEPAIPDYTVSSASDIQIKGRKPFQVSDASYAMLVNPGTSDMNFSGTYSLNGDNRNWQFTSNATAGTANNYNIDADKGIGFVKHHLQIGDFFLADGRLLSKDAPAEEVAAADVIGLVYTIDPGRIGEAEKQALGGIVHGSVISTTCVTSPYETLTWCNEHRDEAEIGFEYIMGTTSAETRDNGDKQFSGLRDLNNIREKRPAEYAAGEYEAFLYSTLHGSGHKDFATLQSVTTGWYVPAIGQWFDIARNLCGATLGDTGFLGSGLPDLFSWTNTGPLADRFNAYMKDVDADHKHDVKPDNYYSASTLPSSDKWYYLIGIANTGFHCTENSKYNPTYCRPVLTF